MADGITVEDPDWGTENNNYWVIYEHKRYIITEDELVTVPNKFGRAVVWPYFTHDEKGEDTYKIRCFMPGAGT